MTPLVTKANIKYRYALDENGQVIDVISLTDADRKDYICLGCEKNLRPVLPKDKQKHFRHKVAADCSLETYLHRMGILLFLKTYQTCLSTGSPFFLDTPENQICRSCPDGPCVVEIKASRVDLTKKFKYAEIEPSDRVEGRLFIPDVLLRNGSNEKIYVEIVFSHESEAEKIAAGVPILEIDITQESDLSIIVEKEINFQDQRIRLYNFSEESVLVDNSNSCPNFAERKRIEKLEAHIAERHGNVLDCIKKTYGSAIEDGKPFLIRIERPRYCNRCDGGPCKLGYTSQDIDLTKHFKDIIEEIPLQGSKVPRLAIMNDSGRKIYFEYRDAFQRNTLHDEIITRKEQIIELREQKHRNSLELCYELINFEPKSIEENNCDCVNNIYCFKVFRGGRSRIDYMVYSDFKALQKNLGNIIYINLCPDKGFETFIQEVETAYTRGVAIKNCFLCRYHAGANNYYDYESEKKGGIFCKFLKRNCRSNKAAKCEYFRPDQKVLGTVRYPKRYRW